MYSPSSPVTSPVRLYQLPILQLTTASEVSEAIGEAQVMSQVMKVVPGLRINIEYTAVTEAQALKPAALDSQIQHLQIRYNELLCT
jgi:hypothetical protein